MRASQRCEARPCILDLSASIEDCVIPSKSTTPPTLGIFDLELTRVAAAACCLMLCYSHRISRAVQFMETLEEGLARKDINWTLSETIAWLRALREEVDCGKHGDADKSEM